MLYERVKKSGLSKDLKRSRAAVDLDVHELESVGIVKSEFVVNPGHGRCRMISPANKDPLTLQVQAIL